MIKTDRNGSLAVQLYSFLCGFKFLVRHEAAIFSNRSFYFANVMFYGKQGREIGNTKGRLFSLAITRLHGKLGQSHRAIRHNDYPVLRSTYLKMAIPIPRSPA